MKKIILYILLFIFLVLFVSVGYFSIFGIKTKNFNNQIIDRVNKIDKNLVIELDKVQLYLNLKKLNIEAKTLNPKIFFKNQNIKIESINTLISLKSFLKREFALENLNISTKSNTIKNILSLIGVISNSPEIYVLQDKIKKGYLVADIKINFDENGKIKENFRLDGFVKDGQVDILRKYSANDINFLFKFQNNNYDFKDIKLSLNDLDFFSEKISLINENNNVSVNGSFENKILELDKNQILDLTKLFTKIEGFKKIKFSSKSDFSFTINNIFKIKDLSLVSILKIENLSFKNKKKGKYFFPEIKDKIFLKKQNVEVNLKDNIFSINGSGDILLQENIDKIKYSIIYQKKHYQIDTTLELDQNPLSLQFLNYQKPKNTSAIIKVKTLLNKDDEINFELIEIKEKANQILFENIFLDKDFKIIKIDNMILDYIDSEEKENKIILTRNKDNYNLIGKIFNANSLINRILKNNDNRSNLFKKNFKLNMEIDKVYLDRDNSLIGLKGDLNMVNNDIKSANIISEYSNNKKFNFSIKSNDDQKITTLFSEKAEPLVHRYNFIKGYEEGSLDFYSIKTNDKSVSTLSIFDFKLQELPALTKLLTLASLQGIADTLTGEGIRFNELEMNFTSNDNTMTIDELYAIGPAISILMSGYVDNDKLVSLRGTLVPATTINKTIGSIPLLGKILVGSKVGEGVFGVSFKIKGHPDDLETTVNPLKTLTPRFITRTLEKIKKTN